MLTSGVLFHFGSARAILLKQPQYSTHELSESYDHRIRWNQERYQQVFLIVSLIGVVFIVFLFYWLSFEFPPTWLESTLVFTGAVAIGIICVGVPLLIEARRLKRKRETAISYPAHVSLGVERAHENVKEWLTDPSEEQLKPRLFERLCKRYSELETLSMDDIRNKLEASGVWNANNKWYEKGRTLDDGLMMAIYTRKADKETAEVEATRATHKKISYEAATAPDLQIRKQAEQQKEAVARELEELDKEPDGFIDWELDELEGNAGLHLRGDYVVRVTFNLPSGVYKITVTDTEKGQGRKSQKLLRMNGEPQDLEVTPPIKNGHILVVNEAGKADTIGLD